MPIYEYQCQNCGAQLEVMQKISDAPLTECTTCGGVLEKQWSQTSFQLKGSGWYVSDYGKGGVKPKEPKETKETKETDDKTEKKADKSESAATEAPAPAANETTKADKPATTPAAGKTE